MVTNIRETILYLKDTCKNLAFWYGFSVVSPISHISMGQNPQTQSRETKSQHQAPSEIKPTRRRMKLSIVTSFRTEDDQ